MGERVNGIHEVRGSIPLASTDVPRSIRGGARPVGVTPEAALVFRGFPCATRDVVVVVGRLAQLVRAPR